MTGVPPVGSGAVIVPASGFRQNLAGIAILIAGSIGYFVLLRGIVRLEHGGRGGPRLVRRQPARTREE